MELFISFLTAFVNIVLGLFTFLKNPKSSTNRLFTFLTLQIAFWAVVNYFSLHALTEQSTLNLIRTVMFDAAFMGPTIYLLLKTFPNQKIKLSKTLQILIWILTFITAIAAISPFMFVSVSIENGNVQPTPGPLIALFAINFIGFLITAIITIIRRYIKASGIEKLQIKFIFYGIGLTFSLIAITNFLFVILLRLSSFVTLGPLFSLILVGFTFYAIVRHRLMDVRLVVARSVAYIFLIGIIAAFYTGAVFVVGNLFFTGKTDFNQTIVYASLTIFVAFTFQPLRYFLEKITDRVFFKNNYNSNELLSKLTKILASTLSLDDLSRKTLNQIFNTMHISRGTFYIFQNNHPALTISGGIVEKNKYSNEKMLKICEKKKIMVLDEEEDENSKEIMRNLKASIILPLHVGEKMHGLLLLGEKRSGDIYFNKDIEVLKIFGPEVSVALENAKAYEEIRRFNITLKEEVDHATKDLQDANVKLKEIDKLKDEFVSLASHELRTPMTVIKSYLWMMLDKNNASALSEKQRMYVDRAYTSTQRLINLVNDMLNVSRIESGRFTLAMKPIDLGELINTVYTEMLPKAQEQKINLQFAKPLQPLFQVSADPERVEQVLINLIGNSLKFTSEKGTIRIEVNSNPTEKTETVSIIDNGKGISAEDMTKLFQKFSMVGGNYLVKQNAQGTGLGLYLSKAMIELMGGKIWVESEGEGKGSKFSFTLKTA